MKYVLTLIFAIFCIQSPINANCSVKAYDVNHTSLEEALREYDKKKNKKNKKKHKGKKKIHV